MLVNHNEPRDHGFAGEIQDQHPGRDLRRSRIADRRDAAVADENCLIGNGGSARADWLFGSSAYGPGGEAVEHTCDIVSDCLTNRQTRIVGNSAPSARPATY